MASPRGVGEPSLAGLPCEVLVHILCRVPLEDRCNAAAACKSLRSAAERVLASSTFLDLKAGSSVMDSSWFSRFCQRLDGRSLERLELDCWHLDDSSLQHIPGSVQELTLSGCDHHSDALIEGMARRLAPHLVKFAFSGFGGHITERVFLGLAASCRALVSFAFDSGQKMDPNHVVRAVASCCPGLQELSAYDLTPETLVHMRLCRLKLTRLRLKRRHVGFVTVTDSALCDILAISPQLAELQIIDKTENARVLDLSDVGLLSLVERAASLRVLKLRLPSPAPLTWCSEVALMQLANACTRLNKLELSNLRCLSDPALYEFIHRCPELAEVHVAGSSITDASLESLAAHCPALHTLSVSMCRKVSDTGVRALARCPQLRSLNAGVLHRLTDSAVADVCSQASAVLTSLVLNQSLVSDAALGAIGRCSALEELALHGCANVSNLGLRLIAAGCPRLRHLSLSYCERISDAGVIAIANSCRHLLKIRLDGCRHLSNPCVRALCLPKWALHAPSSAPPFPCPPPPFPTETVQHSTPAPPLPALCAAPGRAEEHLCAREKDRDGIELPEGAEGNPPATPSHADTTSTRGASHRRAAVSSGQPTPSQVDRESPTVLHSEPNATTTSLPIQNGGPTTSSSNGSIGLSTARNLSTGTGVPPTPETPQRAVQLRYLSMQGCPKLSDHVFPYLLQAPGLRFVDLASAKLSMKSSVDFALSRPNVEFCIDGTPFTFGSC